MRLVELSRSEHRELRIHADRIEACAARQHLIPIVVGEFRKAATEYPIVFAKHPETGRFASYVLSGLALEENLFWSGTQLDVAYVPLNVRRQPFYVGVGDAPDSGSTPSNVLCIDLDHPCLEDSTSDGSIIKMIVNADGSDSAYLKEILVILGELIAGKPATESFIAAILSLDLLAPIVLDIVLDDGTPLQVQGLYGLDEEKFRQLEAAQIAALWNSGHLDPIYAVMIASGQIFKLIRLKNQRSALSRAWQGQR